MKMKNRISVIFALRRFRRFAAGTEIKRKVRRKMSGGIYGIRSGLMEQEIFSSCILLKNLAIVHKGAPLSMDRILEELAEGSVYLKPIYNEVLFRWRSGEGDEAFSIISDSLKSKAASNFARILARMDRINPAELAGSMKSFEEAFQGERVTAAMRRAYMKSVITTVVSVAGIFAILMNFVVVVVFMNMKDMLSGLG